MTVWRGVPASNLKFKLDKRAQNYNANLKFFTYSREAIIEILRLQQICQEDEVIVPNYICSTVVSCILLFTKRIKFYPINSRLKYSNVEVVDLLTARSKLIILVDYFGVHTDVDLSLLSTLKRQGVVIVKDASHAFLTEFHDDFAMKYDYDYLISSVYKNLPMQVGAVGLGRFSSNCDFVSFKTFAKRFLISCMKRLLYHFGVKKFLSNNMSTIQIGDGEKLKFSRAINIVYLYKKVLSLIDTDEIIKLRKSLSMEIYDVCSDNKTFNSVFSIAEISNNVLQDFPLYFENTEQRDHVLNFLLAASIDAYTWPTYHPVCNDRELWHKLLIVPIDRKVISLLHNV